MCGIVGCAGLLIERDYNFFNDMLIMDIVRGPHGTGVAMVPKFKQSNCTWIKKAGLPFGLLESKAYQNHIKKEKRVLIGHNRFATKGTVEDKNSHPFTHGNITGVHNGTLVTQSRLPDHEKFSVDSENIIYAINKEGIKDTWKRIEGGTALVYWDAKKHTINFVRNRGRPLYYAFSTKGNTIYWASEEEMLVAALERNNIFYKDPIMLVENTHCAIEVPTFSANNESHLKEMKSEKLVPFSYPIVIRAAGYGGRDSYTKREEERVVFTVEKFDFQTHGKYAVGHSADKKSLCRFNTDVVGASEETLCKKFNIKGLIGQTFIGESLWKSYLYSKDGHKDVHNIRATSVELYKDKEEEKKEDYNWMDIEYLHVPVSLKDFYERYTVCQHCKSLLDPDADNYYYDKNEALCPLCHSLLSTTNMVPEIRAGV